jgi:antitoxin VapB
MTGAMTVPLTRAFKSGNSQAVRIPAELAYSDLSQDLRISRVGEVIVIFPARGSLKDAVAILRDLPKPPEAEIREAIDPPERNRD